MEQGAEAQVRRTSADFGVQGADQQGPREPPVLAWLPQSAATFIHVNVALSRWVALQPWKIAGAGAKAMIDMGWSELVEPSRPTKKYMKSETMVVSLRRQK